MRTSVTDESGFTLIETLLAIVVLTVGILGMMVGFVAAQKLSLVAERHTTMSHVAQREIERIEGIAYSQIGLSSSPSPSTDPNNPDYYVVAGSPLKYEYDRTAGTSEALDVDATAGSIPPVQ